MMMRGLFGLLFWTFSGSASAFHHRGWTGSSVMGILKKDASAGRRTQSASETACNALKEVLEDASETQTCNCEAEVDGMGTTSLDCIQECEYCNNDLTICGQLSSGELFDENGDVIVVTESFFYTKGRNELVTFRNAGCDGDNCGSCQVFVDGQECESCTLNLCLDGQNQNFQLPSFSCTNLEADAVYDVCDEPLIVPDGSVFEFLTTDGDEFGICILPTEAPSSTPSNVPSLTPTMAASATTPPTVLISTTDNPSGIPSDMPSLVPSSVPSFIPSDMPSLVPSGMPTPEASELPSAGPLEPTLPTVSPEPTANPTAAPSRSPTPKPATPEPTSEPTAAVVSSSPVQYSMVYSLLGLVLISLRLV